MTREAGRRGYHHGNLREAVLEAAGRALEEGGIGSISLREIGRSLAVSHTAPRRHFATKQALLDALAIHGYAQLGVELSDALRENEKGFEARLQRTAAVLVGFALRHPVLLGHMFAAKHRQDASAELIEASEAALSSGVKVIADGQANGEVVAGDPELLALVPFATVQGLIVVSNHGSFKGLSLERLVQDAVHRIVAGLCPR